MKHMIWPVRALQLQQLLLLFTLAVYPTVSAPRYSLPHINTIKMAEAMPLRRSARNTIQDAQPSNRDAVTSRLKRGSHGFHKLKNGLLNVTPIGDEEKALWVTLYPS
jgi:hypothetical protein